MTHWNENKGKMKWGSDVTWCDVMGVEQAIGMEGEGKERAFQ